MSIRRQIEALRGDKYATKEALNRQGVEDIQTHGFDHFPEDIDRIQSRNAPLISNYLPRTHIGTTISVIGVIEEETGGEVQ